MSPPRGFADLADLPEDERIRVIGDYIERQPDGFIAGVVVDHDKDGRKAKRYAEKLTTRYKVRVIDTSPGPVPKSTLLRIGKRGDA